MKIIKLGTGLAAGLLAFSAHASNLGYTMVGIDLTSSHYDEDINLGAVSFSSTAGATLYGSYQLNDNFFLMLAAGSEGNEENGYEFSTSVSYVGGGFALPVGKQTDVVIRLALVSVEGKYCDNYSSWSICYTDDDNGYGTALGIRHMATQNIEVNADFTHVNLDKFDDSDIVTIGGAYWFGQHHSVRLSFGDTDDAKTSALGYRYTF